VEFSPGREPAAFFVLGSRFIRMVGPYVAKAEVARKQLEAECRHLAPLVAVGAPPPPSPAPTPEELRALRALGYVQ
jgi:hypothetical protein